MDIYTIYLRRSRADAEKEALGQYETLAKHEQELTELARSRGLVVDGIYKELVSGESISERHEFQKLMERVQSGELAGVIVHSVSRLGRGDPMDYGWVLMTLRMSKTVIVTPTKTYDPNDADDARFLQFEMFVSQIELDSIKSRLVSGMRASAKAGCFAKSIAPMGYDRVKVDGRWTLAPNGDAALVRSIFERSAAGESRGGIASSLNDAGIKTPNGGTWTAARILSMISNPHYMGKIRYGYYRRTQVPGEGFKVRTVQTTDPDGCTIVDGLHEGIVDKKTWEAANAPRGQSTRTRRGAKLKNPLAGLLVCAKCGHAMLRYVNTCPSNGNKIEHLRHPRFGDCHMRGARLDLVVDMVADALSEIAEDVELGTYDDERESEREALESAVEREERRSERLMEAYLGGAIDVAELRRRRDVSDADVGAMRKRLAEISSDGRSPRNRSLMLKDAITLLRSDDVSPQAKNDALKAIVQVIEFDNRTESCAHPDIHLDLRLR